MSKELRQNIISAIVAGFLTNAIAFGIFLWVTGGKVAVGQQILTDTVVEVATVKADQKADHESVAELKADVREMKTDLKWLTKWAGKEEKRNP